MGKVPQENLSVESLKAERKRKPKPGSPVKSKADKSLRALFRAKLALIEIEKLKKPWMAKKSFQLITTTEQLIAYVDNVLTDESVWQQPYFNKPDRMPVVAVDTETYGLDTRVMVDFELKWDEELGREICLPIYEVNIEIAGICLSADGIKGVYIPLFHEDGQNVPLEVVQEQLQRLFDQSHLVFYNAKFDREVLRQTVGIRFRDYPYFEDIQVLHFSNDPKADLEGDEFIGGGGDGLKGLSKTLLGIEQIDLEEIGKVKANVELSPEELEEIHFRPNWVKLKKKDTFLCETCGDKAAFLREQYVRDEHGTEKLIQTGECAKPECCTKVTYKKSGLKMQYVPFSWVPTEIAVWYAAADAICTWLLWAHRPTWVNREDPEPDILHVEAQKRKIVHMVDGQLIDTLTWMERQRLLVDTERHIRLVKWSVRANQERREKLREIANRHGWEEVTDDDGKVFADTIFNVDSPIDLPKLLFDIKGFTPTKLTDGGKRSCDASALEDLQKLHPHDEFLIALKDYKEYVALHPEKLSWDKRDNSARIYLKQSTVAGGRLAASGGKFDRDGGVNMNIQAIKKVGGNWWVKGDVLEPDFVNEVDVEEREEHELDPSCFLQVKKDEIVTESGSILEIASPTYAESAEKQGFKLRNGKWTKKAPGIIKNHIANYLGYAICLVPGCKSCAKKHGVLISKTKIDANQIINLRALFISELGWTTATTDYSNIEVRAAANISGETELQKIFLEGDGDHHALTASKVFPEFNDPNTTAARRKELRAIAKIINFALQYGGSEFTIYENLKAIIPDITLKKTKEMVDTYWRGVPQFEAWSREKQRIAREQMICTTTSGRIIKFRSAMAALRITEPTPEQKDLCFQYYRIRKQFYESEERAKETGTEEDKAQAAVYKAHMDRLWNDKDTGVRNAIEHNKFMSKIQRVAVNAPVQGLAGDFMRMALNRIRIWATEHEPLVQSVLRVQNSVHDEVDYSTKNPYLPFVVPRITRLMKLRRLHERMKWPVPIESDTEYGQSWDVKYHLTGDDGHKPSGWTDVDGMEEYLPDGFTLEVVDKLIRAISCDNDERREKARVWCENTLHKRANDAAWHAFWWKDKDKVVHRETDLVVIRKQLIAAIQLHEYWSVDAVPDGEDSTLETFLEYEQRRGLTPADRGFMPEGGWLYSVPQDRIRRKQVPVLGPAPIVEPEEALTAEDVEEAARQQGLFTAPDYSIDYHEQDDREYDDYETVTETPLRAAAEALVNAVVSLEGRVNAMSEKLEEAVQVKAAPVVTEDEMFLPAPKKRESATPVTPPPTPAPVVQKEGPSVPTLRDDLTEAEVKALMAHLDKNMGELTVQFMYRGQLATVRRCFRSDIPAQYLREEVTHG